MDASPKGLQTMLNIFWERKKNNDIIVICHGAVNRVIICKALGLNIADMFNIHQDYGCLNIIDYFSDSRIMRLINGWREGLFILL